MNLRELELDTFMDAIVRVHEQMADDDAFQDLLDSASKDIPIIAELLAEMNKLYQQEDGPQKEKGVATAQRDLMVLLALREIENAGQ